MGRYIMESSKVMNDRDLLALKRGAGQSKKISGLSGANSFNGNGIASKHEITDWIYFCLLMTGF